MNIKTAIQIMIGVAGYCVWGFIAWIDPSQRAGFLALNVTMVTGTIGLVLRDMGPAQSSERPPSRVVISTAPSVETEVGITGQSGRAMPFLMALIAILAVMALAACSSMMNAGISELTANSQTGDIHVVSGKEYASLAIKAVKSADGSIAINVDEAGVKAFGGQQIAATAQQSAFDTAYKVIEAAALAAAAPALLPAAGAALASPGLGAAVVGGGVVLGSQKLGTP